MCVPLFIIWKRDWLNKLHAVWAWLSHGCFARSTNWRRLSSSLMLFVLKNQFYSLIVRVLEHAFRGNMQIIYGLTVFHKRLNLTTGCFPLFSHSHPQSEWLGLQEQRSAAIHSCIEEETETELIDWFLISHPVNRQGHIRAKHKSSNDRKSVNRQGHAGAKHKVIKSQVSQPPRSC